MGCAVTMGIYHLVQVHGVAPVIAGVVAIKCIKYKFVCWRSNNVNQKVHDLVEEKLENDLLDEDEDCQKEQSHRCSEWKVSRGGLVPVEASKPLAIDGDSVCACCECPMWLRRDDVEGAVRLG